MINYTEEEIKRLQLTQDQKWTLDRIPERRKADARDEIARNGRAVASQTIIDLSSNRAAPDRVRLDAIERRANVEYLRTQHPDLWAELIQLTTDIVLNSTDYDSKLRAAKMLERF